MKNVLKILILVLIFTSCKKKTEEKIKFVKSEFNLNTDLTDFKHKMTELDTIKIWFDHSVCMSQSFERIEITKISDSIRIHSKFKDNAFSNKSIWKTIFDGKINKNDTVWQIEEFLKKNTYRQKSDEKIYGTLQISHNETKINYFTKGLVDLQKFIVEYNTIMKKLYPKTVDIYYNEEVPLLSKDMKKKLETELEN